MAPIEYPVPLVGFVAPSGTGKTTLLEAVVRILTGRGLRVALVKHTHHRFDIDQPGKDSYRLREAGARQVMVGSSRRWALMTELPEGREEPDLAELLAALDAANLDLVLVEGFKHETFPKVELHRTALGRPPLFPGDPAIVAVATDPDTELDCDRVRLDINDPDSVAAFVVERFLEGTG